MSRFTHIVRRYGLACAAGVALTTGAFAQEDHRLPQYRITDMGALDGGQSFATSMNGDALAVGWSHKVVRKSPRGERGRTVARHAFGWSPTLGMIDLGTLGGSFSEARDINADGVVVGFAETSEGTTHAFVACFAGGTAVMWDLNDLVVTPDPMKPMLGAQASFGTFFEATAINDANEIVACAFLRETGDIGGFLLRPRTARIVIEPGLTPPKELFEATYLGRLPGAEDCVPYGLNVSGGVVGVSGDRAFFWEGGIAPLAPKTRYDQAAYAISDGFLAVGAINGQACIWDCRTPMPPTKLDHRVYPIGEALDLNDALSIVGWSAPATGERSIATLWDDRNTQIDLNRLATSMGSTMFSSLTVATAIDTFDRIIGAGVTADGAQRAFLLTPLRLHTIEAAGEPCMGDCNGDGIVGFDDLLQVLSRWGPCPDFCPEDFDGNGEIDFQDLLVVLSGWGPCP